LKGASLVFNELKGEKVFPSLRGGLLFPFSFWEARGALTFRKKKGALPGPSGVEGVGLLGGEKGRAPPTTVQKRVKRNACRGEGEKKKDGSWSGEKKKKKNSSATGGGGRTMPPGRRAENWPQTRLRVPQGKKKKKACPPTHEKRPSSTQRSNIRERRELISIR